MTIEIRELVIEAHVREPVRAIEQKAWAGLPLDERERLLEDILQRVLERLNEERWS
ncbi:DUF5908 family protein [Pseudomonas koreensis]|uniref:DUF5908 family protein n=1 Tax=Pseudomonas koreensis TaxID=198620 RepID=UPI003F82AC50